MFTDFAEQWTPVLPLKDVTNKPQRIVLAGEPLVVWRKDATQIGVLLDRCPHRSVSLALGKRTETGDLACAFHGWEFDATGACTHLPFNPDQDRGPRGATALPHRELAGLLWVYTGFEPTTEPYLPEVLLDESLVRFEYHELWDAHWTRAMENMLDFPHLPYVHRTTIGRFVRAKQQRHSKLTMDVTDTDHGFLLRTSLDEHPPAADLSWYRPNGMSLDTIPDPKLLRIHIWCVPAEQNRVRMLMVVVRNFARTKAASLPIDRFNVHVLHQDRAVVESSDPIEVPDSNHVERSVRTDRPTLKFRTWYLRNLKGSSVEGSSVEGR